MTETLESLLFVTEEMAIGQQALAVQGSVMVHILAVLLSLVVALVVVTLWPSRQ